MSKFISVSGDKLVTANMDALLKGLKREDQLETWPLVSFAAALAFAFTSSGAENKTSTLTEVFLGVAIIFLIGFAIGSVVFWIYPGHSSIVRRLDTHLNGVLSEAERDLLGPTILSMADKGLYEINGRAEMEARMASLRQQATDLRLDVVKELLVRGRF